jgi:hypothetical protein
MRRRDGAAFEGLPSFFLLREEACESWDYFLSDKLIHIPKFFEGSNNARLFRPETNKDVTKVPWHFCDEQN